MAHPMDGVMQTSPRAPLFYPPSTLYSLILRFRLRFDSVKHASPLKVLGRSSIIHGHRRALGGTALAYGVMGGGGELLRAMA